MKSDSPSASRAAQRPAISRADRTAPAAPGPVAAAFEEHADEDLQHGMWAAERVSRLGRDPDFNSATLKECSHTEYVTVDDADLTRILKELGRRTDRDHHL
jgi:hypothetical protein